MVKRTFIDILATLNCHVIYPHFDDIFILSQTKLKYGRTDKKVQKLQIQKHKTSINVSETFGIEDLGIESKNLLHHEIIYQN